MKSNTSILTKIFKGETKSDYVRVLKIVWSNTLVKMHA